MKIFQTMLFKYLTFAICLIFSYSHNLIAQQISVDELAEALLSQMSPEEQEQLLRETEALFKSLSPEELMELGKASEELLREELKKEGLDLLPIEPTQTPQPQEEKPQPFEEKPGTNEVKTDKFGEPIVQIDSKLLNRAKIVLNDIVDMIAEIEQRAENQRNYKEKIAQIQADLDLLSSFLNIVNQYKLVRYFADKEHSAAYEHIVGLYNQLNQHIDSFKPEKAIEATNPYHELGLPTGATEDQVKKQYRTLTTEHDPELLKEKLKEQGVSPEMIRTKVTKARRKFDKVVDSFQRIETALATEKAFDALYRALQRALFTHNISQGIKNIFEAHAPEALKMATEAEKRAQEARKSQEAAAARYPTYSPMVFDPSYYQQPRYYYPDASRDAGRGVPSPVAARPAPPAPIKPTDIDKGKKEDKKPEKKPEKKPADEKILGEKTFYQALKIGNKATAAQISQAYSKMKGLYTKADPDAIKDWSLITDAYDILKDSHLRSMYNRYLRDYLPKDAHAKIMEYKKSLDKKKKEEELEKKVDELKAPAVKTAQEAQQLFSKQAQEGLSDATAQLNLEATTLADFDTFLQKPYNPQDLLEINIIKNILSLATSYLDTAIKAIQKGRSDNLLQNDAAEATTFNKNSLKAISDFLAQNRTILQKLKTAQPATAPSEEKKYILFGVPYAPALPGTVPPRVGLAVLAPPVPTLPPQDILDANPQKINFVGNFVNKVKELEAITADIQQDLQQAAAASAAATASATP